MAGPIALKVLTQEGLALEDEAVSVIAPGEVGYLGVLRNHAPLVTTLTPGKLIWQRPDGSRKLAQVGRGLLEVQHNRITLLTDSVGEWSEFGSSRSPHG